jgi:hypothetical protein
MHLKLDISGLTLFRTARVQLFCNFEQNNETFIYKEVAKKILHKREEEILDSNYFTSQTLKRDLIPKTINVATIRSDSSGHLFIVSDCWQTKNRIRLKSRFCRDG